MDSIKRNYYQRMLSRNRLIPFTEGNRMVCFLTYYIVNSSDLDRFVSTDPWIEQDDDDKGNTCYISQLITDKHSKNPFLSYGIWARFKEHIRRNYPLVTTISWKRWKGDKINVYDKTVK